MLCRIFRPKEPKYKLHGDASERKHYSTKGTIQLLSGLDWPSEIRMVKTRLFARPREPSSIFIKIFRFINKFSLRGITLACQGLKEWNGRIQFKKRGFIGEWNNFWSNLSPYCEEKDLLLKISVSAANVYLINNAFFNCCATINVRYLHSFQTTMLVQMPMVSIGCSCVLC